MGSSIRALQWLSTPMGMNGQTLFPIRICEGMPDIPSDFATYSIEDGDIRSRAEATGATVFVLPHRLRHPLRYYRAAVQLLREQKYDIVHCHGNSCTLALELLAAKRAGIAVRIAHSHNSKGSFPLIHRLLRPAFDRSYTHAMACSENAGKWMFGKRPFEVIPNAIDPSAYQFDEAQRERLRSDWGWSGCRIVGVIGAFVPAKNHAFLLNAFAKARSERSDLRLILVGDGPLRPALERQCADLGIGDSTRFLGKREDVPALLSAMDLLAQPSLHEGLPTVALEAQCSGLTALLSQTITRETSLGGGVSFLPLNEAQWRDALISFTPIDRAEASRMGMALAARRGFDRDRTAKALRARYIRMALHTQNQK